MSKATTVPELLDALQQSVDRAKAARGEQPPAPTPELQAGHDPVEVLRECLYGLADELETLDRGTTYLKHVEDFDTLLELHHEATVLLAKLRTAVGSFHDRAWALRGQVYGDHHHHSLGVVSVRRTAKKERWAHAALGERVVDAHLTATEGEMPDPSEVARWVLEAAAPGYWRKTVLKALGIDYEGEDLYTKERGTPAITFPSSG